MHGQSSVIDSKKSSKRSSDFYVENEAKSEFICYVIGGNRYCGNINREHKSNSIYLVADLKNGESKLLFLFNCK